MGEISRSFHPVMMRGLCLKIPAITYIISIIERFERIIIPITFIGLGMFVLLENGTIQNILNLLW